MTNTVTFHDQRPSHPIKPAWLLEVEQEQHEADKKYSAFVDEALDTGEWDHYMVGYLGALADVAYRRVLLYRENWQAGSVPVALEIEALQREGAEV